MIEPSKVTHPQSALYTRESRETTKLEIRILQPFDNGVSKYEYKLNVSTTSQRRCTTGYPDFGRIIELTTLIFPNDLYPLKINERNIPDGSKSALRTSPDLPTSLPGHFKSWRNALYGHMRQVVFQPNFLVPQRNATSGLSRARKRKLKRKILFDPVNILQVTFELLLIPVATILLLAGNMQFLLESIFALNILPSIPIIVATLVPAIKQTTRHLFLEFRLLRLHQDELEIEYLISDLIKKRDFGLDYEDLYWTLNVELPGIYLYIKEFNSQYRPSLPFVTATVTHSWLNQLNQLISSVLSNVKFSSHHSSQLCEDSYLTEHTLTFCKGNRQCSSSAEFSRLHECEQHLENLEFDFLSFMTVGPSDDFCIKKLHQLSLKTEQLQNDLCSVGSGLCCCLDTVRSLRKWLNKRCETLLDKTKFSINNKDANLEMFGIYIRLPDGSPLRYKMVQPCLDIETLSQIVEDEFRVTDFYLTVNGKILSNNLSIHDENITPSSIIDVQLRLRGGTNPPGQQVLSTEASAASDCLDIGHLYSTLLEKLPLNWKVSITDERQIRLSFSPERDEKKNVNERQIFLTQTGTLTVKLLNQRVQWHEGYIKGDTYEQLVDNILCVMRKVERCKICSGIYNQDVLAFSKEHLTTTCNFTVDSNWTIPSALNNKLIRETVRSSGQLNGCLLLVRDTGRSERCKNCQRLWNNSLRFKLNGKQSTSNETQAHSRVNLSLLTYPKLLERARNMGKEIKKLKMSNSNMRKLLRKRNQVAAGNFNPSRDDLVRLVDFAVENNILKKDTILYAFMQDAMTQLNLMHAPDKKGDKVNDTATGTTKPKGMRWDTLTIKFAVALAVKCKAKGYEAVRKWLPLPSWRLVQGYRMADMTTNPIDVKNLELCWQEIKNREVKGLFGLHWDEMDIHDGIRLCRRTGKLIGFEDLSIPKEYECNVEELCNNDPEDFTMTGLSSDKVAILNGSDDEEEYLDEEDNDYYEETESKQSNMQKNARQICQFFLTSLEGDFAWPVASFPVHSVTAEKLDKNMLWPLLRALDKVSGGNIIITYGVCDGGPWNSKFFNKSSGCSPWVTPNPVTGGYIHWISDFPHMIKKLRNFIYNPSYNLRKNGNPISWEHVLAVSKYNDTKISEKHVLLDGRTKMKVKYAREVLSESTAKAMERDDFPFTLAETKQTRAYIRMCDQLFRIMNTTVLSPSYMKQLITVLRWFQAWYSEKEEEARKNHTKGGVWEQFIPRRTYQDLMVMIRGIIGTIGYISLNYPGINVVPKSMCQDDVENYFSLVRGREVSPTVQRFFEIRKSLVTDFNISNELGMMEGSSSSYDAPALQMKPHKTKFSKKLTNHKDEKAARKEKFLNKIRALLLKTSSKPVHLTYLTKLPPHYCIEPHHEEQLLYQCNTILEIIDQALPKALLNRTVRTIEALKDTNNKELFANFNILLDRNIRTNFFTSPGFCEASYIAAEDGVFNDDAVYSWWTSLTNQICGGSEGTEEAMYLYVTKFLKRRCVTYIAKDGLSPSFRRSKPTRQRVTGNKNLHLSKSKTQQKAKPSDVCLRCGMLGHWAKECTEPPKPEWLANQTCFKCGCLGHLAESCKSKKKAKCKASKDVIRRPNLPNIVSSLPTVNLEDQLNYKYLKEAPSHVSDQRPYLKQRTEKWFEERKKHLNASKMGTVLGLHGKTEFMQYWSSLHGMSPGVVQDPSSISKLSMEWGTICEDNARITYLDYIGQTNPDSTVHETGLWVINWKGTEMIACSPDDIVEMDNTGIKPTSGRGITEYKCPFKGGFPCHYKTIPPSYFIQTQLNMLATDSTWCHLVVWTPKTTRIYIVLRDSHFLDSLLNATYYHYWSLKTRPDAPHPTLLDVKKQAEKKANQVMKLTEMPSLCATSCLGKLSQFTPQNVDLLSKRSTKQNIVGVRQVKHCTKCKRLLTVCNKDKCEGKRIASQRSLATNARIPQEVQPCATASNNDFFPSFRNGSGGIQNSCHQDALLVIFNEIFTRNPHMLHLNTSDNVESQCMATLKEMHQLFRQEQFHESKMKLWTWLQNRTTNGRMYFGIGTQCSLEAILPTIRQKLTDIESKFITTTTKTSKKCLKHNDHKHQTKEISKATNRIVEETFIPEDRLCNSDNTSPINLTKYFERVAAVRGTTWLSASCSSVLKDTGTEEDIVQCVRCDMPATCTTKIESLPDVIVLEIVKKNDGPLPYLPHLDVNMVVRGNHYRLVGLIYYSRAKSHYWSDVYVERSETRHVKTGWYTHDGLSRSGNAVYAQGPSFSSDGQYLSLVFYEKVSSKSRELNNSQNTTSGKKQHARTWHQSLLQESGLTPPSKKMACLPN